MKSIVAILMVLTFACVQPTSKPDVKRIVEEQALTFTKNYIRDLNSPNWPNLIGPYLRNVEFIERQKKFREVYKELFHEIKRIMVDSNEVILWMNVYSTRYDQENLAESNGSQSRQTEANWTSVWYFDVVDGKFGEKWDHVKLDVE